MAIDPNEDLLRALLARGAETDDLDFKATWNPQRTSDLVELCKDVAAMESLPSGGCIVVGALDNGSPSGMFAPTNPKDFDEQRVRSKIVALIGEPLDLKIALYVLGSNTFLLLKVGANSDGMRVLPHEGKYRVDNSKEKIAWRPGDVFVRRGTSSVCWNQHEARGLIDRVVASRKETWRQEILETIRASTPAFTGGQFVNVNAEMPAAVYPPVVTELIRRHDDVGLDVLRRRTRSDAVRSVCDVGNGDARAIVAELSDDLYRLDVIASLCSRYRLTATFTQALVDYQEIYEAVDEDYVAQPRRFPLGHVEVLVHLYAVGAVLVHERKWIDLATLTRLAPLSTHGGYWKSLLQKAQVMAARTNTLTNDSDAQVGVIEAAKSKTAQLFDLLGEGDPRDLTSLLVQFDVYRGVATANSDENGSLGAYPNFCLYYTARAEPAFLTLIEDSEARAALFNGNETQLANVYRRMDNAARNAAQMYNGYDGFEDSRLRSFAGIAED